jgi:hypothetical protein
MRFITLFGMVIIAKCINNEFFLDINSGITAILVISLLVDLYEFFDKVQK